MICMIIILAEKRLRKHDEVRDTFVYPPLKKKCMTYGKTSKQKWIKFLEEQTDSKVQNCGRDETTHTPITHVLSRPIPLITLEM